LKGSCKAIGTWRAAAAAERAEALSGEGLARARTAQFSDIDASLVEANTYVGALLADR
jgi:hypothetical protein